MATKIVQNTTPKNENKYSEFITQRNRIIVCDTNKIQADIFISLGSSKFIKNYILLITEINIHNRQIGSDKVRVVSATLVKLNFNK